MTLISIIVISYFPISATHLSIYNRLDNRLLIQQNTRLALHYIEKCIQECNQQMVSYFPHDKTIVSKNYLNEKIYIDLSGRKRNDKNTLLYFNRDTGELRVNKNGEHNVLCILISDIKIIEIIEGKLLQIQVVGDNNSYSVTTTIKLGYR